MITCPWISAFYGKQIDVGAGSVFIGSIAESGPSGVTTGTPGEVAYGDGANVGGAVIVDNKTAHVSGFGFGGAKRSIVRFAGLQLGVIAAPGEFGFYYETEASVFASGGGYAYQWR